MRLAAGGGAASRICFKEVRPLMTPHPLARGRQVDANDEIATMRFYVSGHATASALSLHEAKQAQEAGVEVYKER